MYLDAFSLVNQGTIHQICLTFLLCGILFSSPLIEWKIVIQSVHSYVYVRLDTLDQRNARIHISLLASLKNQVVGNGGTVGPQLSKHLCATSINEFVWIIELSDKVHYLAS